MNRRMKAYISYVGVLFALFCWAACSEEGGDTPDPTPDENTLLESVRLRIGASGTVETRNYGGDENAVEGEFINTLRVFIVDENNTIEKVILANDSLDTEEETLAEAGNLTHFTTTVDITPGRKTIYAFANMDIAGYNYGIKRYRHDLKKYPDRLILGSETFCSDAYEFWEMAKKNPRIIGDIVWAGID